MEELKSATSWSPVFDDGNNKGNGGNNDESDNYITNILLNPDVCSQIIANGRKGWDPCKCTDDIIQHKFPEIYFNYTGQYRCKRAYDGKEAANDQCFASILFIKNPCYLQICFFKDEGIFALK